ncbi:MAG: S8 family serine peptidase [Synergistaceae bacterium]|nr:S8 family serine peptidase [Synergistaceae bacterium]
MKKLFRYFIFALLILGFAAGSSFAAMAEYNEGEVLVVMKTPMSAFSNMSASAYAMALEAQATSFAQRKSLSKVCSYPAISQSSGSDIAFFKAEGKTTAQLIEELKEDPEVLSVSANYKRKSFNMPIETYSLTNDAMINKQYGLNRINIFEVWDNYVKEGELVYVAVIDKGVDYRHEDLKDNIAKDSLGRVIGKHFKGNASYSSDDPIDTSEDGHGTHVAGIIGAAGNNRKGIAGVHFKNIKIIPVNVFTGDGPDDGCWDADLIRGIKYVTELKRTGINIRVVNISLGGWSLPHTEGKTAMQVALQELSDMDVILTFAAGNDGVDIGSSDIYIEDEDERLLCFPASFWMIDNKITVGSISPLSCKISEFSNYDTGNVSAFNPTGVQLVDMAAPGEYILSTIPGSEYGYKRGTSMSAPFVAGAAALLCSFFPEKTASEIKQCILNNTFSGRGEGIFWSKGSLNVGKAYLQFDHDPVIPINPNPTIDEQRPIVMEISVHGNVIVDRRIPISVYPDPPGVWSTKPFERAEVSEDSKLGVVLIAKSIGEVEVMYTAPYYNMNVVSARKVLHVLDIYHEGSAGCGAGVVSILTAPFVFFICLALKRRKKRQGLGIRD